MDSILDRLTWIADVVNLFTKVDFMFLAFVMMAFGFAVFLVILSEAFKTLPPAEKPKKTLAELIEDQSGIDDHMMGAPDDNEDLRFIKKAN